MILVGIPAYNEATHISQIVSESKRYCDEVLVVDDGSKDATAKIAHQAGATVIRHPKNIGMGAAENSIILYARSRMKEGDILITLDGDGQHFPDDIPKMVTKMKEGYDVINGSRLYDKDKPGPTPWRRVLNGTATMIVRAMSGFYSTDSQSGFRAYSKPVVDRLIFTSNDYAWNAEGYIRFAQLKVKLGEVPVKTVWTAPSNPDKHHASMFYGIKVLGRLFLIWTGLLQ